jgi:hypothetical protein
MKEIEIQSVKRMLMVVENIEVEKVSNMIFISPNILEIVASSLSCQAF